MRWSAGLSDGTRTRSLYLNVKFESGYLDGVSVTFLKMAGKTCKAIVFDIVVRGKPVRAESRVTRARAVTYVTRCDCG